MWLDKSLILYIIIVEVLVKGTCILTSLISTFPEALLPLVSPFSMNQTFLVLTMIVLWVGQ